jgi:hypothetical protein
MDKAQPYRELRFERAVRALSPRLAAVAVAVTGFGLAWWLIPPGGLFWMLLVTVACLVWVSSFGWRQAVSALVAFLHRLEGV